MRRPQIKQKSILLYLFITNIGVIFTRKRNHLIKLKPERNFFSCLAQLFSTMKFKRVRSFSMQKLCLAISTMKKNLYKVFASNYEIKGTDSLKTFQRYFGESALYGRKIFEWHKVLSKRREIVKKFFMQVFHLPMLTTIT